MNNTMSDFQSSITKFRSGYIIDLFRDEVKTAKIELKTCKLSRTQKRILLKKYHTFLNEDQLDPRDTYLLDEYAWGKSKLYKFKSYLFKQEFTHKFKLIVEDLATNNTYFYSGQLEFNNKKNKEALEARYVTGYTLEGLIMKVLSDLLDELDYPKDSRKNSAAYYLSHLRDGPDVEIYIKQWDEIVEQGKLEGVELPSYIELIDKIEQSNWESSKIGKFKNKISLV